MEGGGEGELYLTLHSHHNNGSALRRAAMRAISNVRCQGQSQDSSQTTMCAEKGLMGSSRRSSFEGREKGPSLIRPTLD